jgi:hypothetical protein
MYIFLAGGKVDIKKTTDYFSGSEAPPFIQRLSLPDNTDRESLLDLQMFL